MKIAAAAPGAPAGLLREVEPSSAPSYVSNNGLDSFGGSSVAAMPVKAQAVFQPGPALYSDFLYRRWYRENVRLAGFVPPEEHVRRVHAAFGGFDISAPLVIEGLTADWTGILVGGGRP